MWNRVVLKGIEPGVDLSEIEEVLNGEKVQVLSIYNIVNRDITPQPPYRVQHDGITFKKSETHLIYNLRFPLHRRIVVEEPHKRLCVLYRQYE